jgi:protein-tyrosine kinase
MSTTTLLRERPSQPLPTALSHPPQADAVLPPLDGEAAAEPGPELAALCNPFGRSAEQFRALRCQLALRLGQPVAGQAQVLSVVGAERGVGRTWVAANLAVSMAQRGGRVLLVDADFRRPQVHRLFGLRAAVGLASMLDGRADYRCLRALPQVHGLHLLPAGAPPAHPLELIERSEFGLVMRQLRLRYTHIVVDTAAGSDGPDAAVVAALGDASLMVLRRHRSPLAGVQALQAALRVAGKPVVGVVFNEH